MIWNFVTHLAALKNNYDNYLLNCGDHILAKKIAATRCPQRHPNCGGFVNFKLKFDDLIRKLIEIEIEKRRISKQTALGKN